LLVRKQTPQPDGSVEVEVEVMPGFDSVKVRMWQIAGQWRMAYAPN
jgi:hypothetical protein